MPYSEPEVGSDLAGLSTQAIRDGSGYRLFGRKLYSMRTHLADLALCAVPTGSIENKYASIRLFLIPMKADGIRIRLIPSILDEQFYLVELNGLRVEAEAIVGEVGASAV